MLELGVKLLHDGGSVPVLSPRMTGYQIGYRSAVASANRLTWVWLAGRRGSPDAASACRLFWRWSCPVILGRPGFFDDRLAA
jgi:hypothetical protein